MSKYYNSPELPGLPKPARQSAERNSILEGIGKKRWAPARTLILHACLDFDRRSNAGSASPNPAEAEQRPAGLA